MRSILLLAVGLASCAPPPARPELSAAPRATTVVAPGTPSATSSASASASAVSSAGPAPAAAAPPAIPLYGDLDGKNLPAAPCDLSRVYRGAVGTSSLTIRVARSGEKVTGLAHYDLPGAAIELTGTVRGEVLTLQEKGGGRFLGSCNATTGRLTGTWELGRRKSSFSFVPRPAGEAALYEVTERVVGKNAAEACLFELKTPRVFGLASPEVERAANAVLTHNGFEYASKSVRDSVKRCVRGEEITVYATFGLDFNAKDVLSVSLTASMNQANAAHGALFGPAAVGVDLQTGRRISLSDVVTRDADFRTTILGCLTKDEDEREFTWGTSDSVRTTPRWTLVPGGIAVVIGDVPPILYGAEGTGPIASFAALARHKLLRADSPVARLWDGVVPAASGEPACPTGLGEGGIVARLPVR